MSFDLHDYNSDEDEDYQPTNELLSDPDSGDDVGAPFSSHSKKRKSSNILVMPSHKGKFFKKKQKSGVGAAVLSDDDEEEEEDMYNEQLMQSSAVEQSCVHSHSNGKSRSMKAELDEKSERQEIQLETKQQNGHDIAPSHSPPSLAPTTSSSLTVDISSPTTAHAPYPAVDNQQINSKTTPTSNTKPSTTTPPSRPQSLAEMMAQFNKPKSATANKPVLMMPGGIIVPNKSTTPPASTISPALAQLLKSASPAPSPTPSPTAASPNKVNTTSSSVPSSTPSPSLPSSSSTSAAATAATPALSDEQIVITELTTYAGEAIEVTKRLVKGSAAEKAYRAAKQDKLSELVSSLHAKKQMNTYDKTRLDWQISKDHEGDAEELELAAKQGYVDKQSFLYETERRQDEMRKSLLRKHAATLKLAAERKEKMEEQGFSHHEQIQDNNNNNNNNEDAKEEENQQADIALQQE